MMNMWPNNYFAVAMLQIRAFQSLSPKIFFQNKKPTSQLRQSSCEAK